MEFHTRSRRFATTLVALTTFLLAAAPAALAQVETLILFDPAAVETPESIVFDSDDNAYISLALTGEVRKIAPDLTQTTLAFLPIGAPCGGQFPPVVTLGLAIDEDDRLFVATSACDPANSGVWEVDTEDGAIEQIAVAPGGLTWNGIDVDDGCMYAADTFGGRVWRFPVADDEDSDSDSGSDSDSDSDSDCSSAPEVWSDDPLLQIAPNSPFPGPNGLQYFRGNIYVANSSTGDIVEIPIDGDGNAGPGSVYATAFPLGCDEFAFDVLARVYCTTDPFNTLLRLSPDGTVEALLTPADLLDGPTSAAFGRTHGNRNNLYIANAAFPFFTTTFRPSLMRLEVDAPGDPEEY